jgi:antitoxin (DNA-binding transcriptional repressor) of toxin-antitoxin stability system
VPRGSCATMCVMDDPVNVRDLRQNLSVHLRLVKAGRTLRVLERGRPIALLTPLPGHGSALERLVSSGRAAPPRLDLAELPFPRAVGGRLTASEALRRQRDER